MIGGKAASFTVNSDKESDRDRAHQSEDGKDNNNHSRRNGDECHEFYGDIVAIIGVDESL